MDLPQKQRRSMGDCGGSTRPTPNGDIDVQMAAEDREKYDCIDPREFVVAQCKRGERIAVLQNLGISYA